VRVGCCRCAGIDGENGPERGQFVAAQHQLGPGDRAGARGRLQNGLEQLFGRQVAAAGPLHGARGVRRVR